MTRFMTLWITQQDVGFNFQLHHGVCANQITKSVITAQSVGVVGVWAVKHLTEQFNPVNQITNHYGQIKKLKYI